MNTDPRLTAYGLGELEGADREAFEAQLGQDGALQEELAEVNTLIEQLQALPGDPEDELGECRRQELLAAMSAARVNCKSPWSLQKRTIVIGAWAAAACIIFGLLLLPAPFRDWRSGVEQEVAVTEPAKLPEIVLPQDFTDPAVTLADALIPPAEETVKMEPAPLSPTWAMDTSLQTQDSSTVKTLSELESKLLSQNRPADTPSSGSTGLTVFGTTLGGLGGSAGMRGSTFREGAFEQRAAIPVTGDLPLTGRLFRSDYGTENYATFSENSFRKVLDHPLSTFAVDVDTASYANVRRFLNEGRLPPPDAVRIEELINYFPYQYAEPTGLHPISIRSDVTRAPWQPEHLLARIALKGREIPVQELPPSNLVFLIDVSGSMKSADKLPLLKSSLQTLADGLRDEDRISIVTYAGAAALKLPPTSGEEKARIKAALAGLAAGGSTAGASGIQLAYENARKHFIEDGNNRVILCTDGDFNVGITEQSELVRLIEKERQSGVFLSILGFGTGNLKDSTMEKLANHGNGNYAYIDSLPEARKVLVEQMEGTLFTIAKDVKIQVEFNPNTVAAYRLIGYENRLLTREDFHDDQKDAGEIGAGHRVTALYEIVPFGQALPDTSAEGDLKYQAPQSAPTPAGTAQSRELFTVKIKYKEPTTERTQDLEYAVENRILEFENAPADFRFATAVAGFGMKLKGTKALGNIGWNSILSTAESSLGQDPGNHRAEFLALVQKASTLPAQRPSVDSTWKPD